MVCGLLHDRVHEPTVTSDTYLDMLQHFVYPQLEQLQPRIIFQQDGAPPHWAKIVRNSLKDKFENRWIGRGGPIPWPPRSPDITPCDFFLWGFVKDVVYNTQVTDLADLKARIVAAIQQIDVEMLERTWQNLEYRLDVLRITNGAHIECL